MIREDLMDDALKDKKCVQTSVWEIRTQEISRKA
jgi:hypothetical protein